MAKKPARVYRRSAESRGILGSTARNPTSVYKNGTDQDRLSITQQVVRHPKQQQARVKEAEASGSEYEELLHCIYDAVIMTDMDGNIFQVNARAEATFMWDREQFSELNIIDVISGADHELLTIVRKNVSNQRFTILEAVCVRNDESRFHAEIVVNKIKGQARKALCFFVRDITVRKQAEEELLMAGEQLVAAGKMKERLETVSTLCRELNNPLQILSCIAEVDQNDELKTQVDRIVTVLQQLINSEALDGVSAEDGVLGGTILPEAEAEMCDASRILVVEDEGMLRNMFVSALKSAFPDISVEAAIDGRRATELFSESFHGVVIMDVSMPVMNGEQSFDEITAICARESRIMPPIIFCTGFVVSPRLQEIIGDGAYHTCIKKPLAVSDLVKTVEEKLAAVYAS